MAFSSIRGWTEIMPATASSLEFTAVWLAINPTDFPSIQPR